MEHRLFITDSKFQFWCQKLTGQDATQGPFPYKLIENYFAIESESRRIPDRSYQNSQNNVSENMLRKVQSEKATQSGCVVLLEDHIFTDRGDILRYFEDDG